MATTAQETVLAALAARLATIATARLTVERGDGEPGEIPEDGAVVIGEGDPGGGDDLLGTEGPFWYDHEIPVECYVTAGKPAARRAAFANLAALVGAALDADLTLGGAVHGLIYDPPAIEEEDASPNIRWGAFNVTLGYESATRV